MITGDNWMTARMIAQRLGIRHVIAEVRLPRLPVLSVHGSAIEAFCAREMRTCSSVGLC